ncbi:MAG: helix-turn-helix domain-containing protein [gamma proteobacterium symbiont of Taylorina sp.]|nr:helix-turn-helix domain-containing protein [gamma proteobacterium symbiont of Taylorina sp.]
MSQISIAVAGFSIIASILLFFQKRTETTTAKILARLLLCILIMIQLIQAMYIGGYLFFDSTVSFFYLLSLGLVGPLFYLYSQHVIQTNMQWAIQEAWHFVPVILLSLLGILLPDYYNIFYSLMFFLGGVYMSCLAWSLYQLRERRTLFKMEFLFTASFLAWSIAVVLIGILSSQVMDLLLPAQTIMLSLLLVAAIHIQLNYPHLLSSLEEIASRQYQTSTLLNVDCDAIKIQLEELMTIKKVYQDAELSLSSCAEMLSLKSHQLSELINTQLGMSFSSYLRQQRITASEILLKTEPEVSVLAVGLSVGFSSQSAFYSAFKDIHSIAPGQYRRQILAK